MRLRRALASRASSLSITGNPELLISLPNTTLLICVSNMMQGPACPCLSRWQPRTLVFFARRCSPRAVKGVGFTTRALDSTLTPDPSPQVCDRPQHVCIRHRLQWPQRHGNLGVAVVLALVFCRRVDARCRAALARVCWRAQEAFECVEMVSGANWTTQVGRAPNSLNALLAVCNVCPQTVCSFACNISFLGSLGGAALNVQWGDAHNSSKLTRIPLSTADLYAIAATIHCLLYNEYMSVDVTIDPNTGHKRAAPNLPLKRYWQVRCSPVAITHVLPWQILREM
jgi:hypothetical protein